MVVGGMLLQIVGKLQSRFVSVMLGGFFIFVPVLCLLYNNISQYNNYMVSTKMTMI